MEKSSNCWICGRTEEEIINELGPSKKLKLQNNKTLITNPAIKEFEIERGINAKRKISICRGCSHLIKKVME